jgi:Xaa-Pro aminopeptidase
MSERERLVLPISDEELERRWAAVRGAMAERGVDVLVMQGFNEFIGGYVKYFTDIPARNGYPDTVIFPRDDGMTVIRQGPRGDIVDPSEVEESPDRGVKKVMFARYFASAHYTKHYDAELAAEEIKPRGECTVGIVCPGTMSAAFSEYLKGGALPRAKFVDATEMVDEIKAIKSDEELERIKETALLQDACMEAAFKAVKPGVKDFELAAIAQHVGQDMGSEQGIYLCSSAPLSTPARLRLRHFQGREIKDGDQFTLLVENNGGGGFYAELGRSCIVGKASQELLDEHAIVLEALRNTVDLLKPGTPCKDIYESHNALMRSRGRPEDRRVYAHGQGYDLVERPLIRDDETMNIRKNMNMTVHPGYATESLFVWNCDNYIVTENGASECIHKTAQKIFEV